MSSNVVVVGSYATPNLAERGVDHLIAVGFPPSAISVERSGTLLAVHCHTTEQIDAAGDALNATGAKNVSTGETNPAAEIAPDLV